MKKRVLSLLIAGLMLLAPCALATSTPISGTFTHPELGNEINFDFREGRPVIALYDMFLYDMHEDETPMREVRPDGVQNVAQVMDNVFTTLDEEVKAGTVETFEVYGLKEVVPETYLAQVNELPPSDRVLAFMMLLGYEEALGTYDEYATPEATAMLDVLQEAKENGEIDLSNWRYDNKGVVTLDGMQYEWNMFTVEITYADGSKMYENYGFVFYDGEWHCHRATLTVLEQVAGAGAEILAEEEGDGFYDDQALREVTWVAPPEDVASQEGATIQDDGRVVVPEVVIYELEAKLDYVYAGDEMLARQFTMDSGSNETFGSLFVSALLRYGDPTATTDRSVTWEFPDVIIIIENTDRLYYTIYPNFGTEEVW